MLRGDLAHNKEGTYLIHSLVGFIRTLMQEKNDHLGITFSSGKIPPREPYCPQKFKHEPCEHLNNAISKQSN